MILLVGCLAIIRIENKLAIWLFILTFNLFPHTTILQQTTLNVFCQNIENLHNWMNNLWRKVENIVAKGEIAPILSNFSFCHYVFKKPSAAEASESVYMRERVKSEIWIYIYRSFKTRQVKSYYIGLELERCQTKATDGRSRNQTRNAVFVKDLSDTNIEIRATL